MLDTLPTAPDYAFDWDELRRRWGWVDLLHTCPQNPIYHAEGDVGIHTRMVCQKLLALPAWRNLPEFERSVLWAAALLHDVAKPECTRLENGRYISPGHAWKGAIRARTWLWQQGLAPPWRELVVGLVKHHMEPPSLVDRKHARRRLLEISLTTRCDLLAILAEADARGRICQDQERLLLGVSLFREFAEEHGCLSLGYPFPSAQARFEYFRKENRDPNYLPYPDFRARATVLSGLPGSGKSTWIAQNRRGLPVVCLDSLRERLGIAPDQAQAPVVEAAREQAREHLRARQDFVWNATNLSRDQRSRCLELLADYRAEIEVVYVETESEELERRNRAREFPGAVVERLLRRWEIPDLTECHHLLWVQS